MYVALISLMFTYFFSFALGTPCDWSYCLQESCPTSGPNAVPNQAVCACAGLNVTASNAIQLCLVEACPTVGDAQLQESLWNTCCSKFIINNYTDVKRHGISVLTQSTTVLLRHISTR